MWKQNQRKFPHSLAIHYLRFASVLSRSLPTPIKAGRFPFAQNLQNSVVHWIVRRGNFLWFCYFSCVNGRNSSRTHVRLGAWFWSAQADIFFSESLHSTLRSGRRKTIVSQTMCALAEHLSQSEIELPLRNTCYYSPLAEVGVSTQTEIKIYWKSI